MHCAMQYRIKYYLCNTFKQMRQICTPKQQTLFLRYRVNTDSRTDLVKVEKHLSAIQLVSLQAHSLVHQQLFGGGITGQKTNP